MSRPISFFNDYEVRKVSFAEKLVYVFTQLHAALSPVETVSSERVFMYNNKYKSIRSIQSVILNVEDKIGVINEIELPFTDICIEADVENIQIIGETFCYKFPPEMCSEIILRMKRQKIK